MLYCAKALTETMARLAGVTESRRGCNGGLRFARIDPPERGAQRLAHALCPVVAENDAADGVAGSIISPDGSPP